MHASIDPITHTLRRAIGTLGMTLVMDGVESGKALLLAWPILETLKPEVWERFQNTAAWGDHPALSDLRSLAPAVVRYDEAAIRRLCTQIDRWRVVALEKMGGTGVPDDEVRRQGYDAATHEQVADALDGALPLEGSVRLLHRVGARLVHGVHRIAEACDDDDLAHDLRFQLTKGLEDFGWWMEGTHLVLLAAEARLEDAKARDLVAEARTILLLLNLGFDPEPELLSVHVAGAGARSVAVLSAIERWLADASAPLDFAIDAAVEANWRDDAARVPGSTVDHADAGRRITAQLEAFNERILSAATARPFDHRALLQASEEGYQQFVANKVAMAPEQLGPYLTGRANVLRSLGSVASVLAIDPITLFLGCAMGNAQTRCVVSPQRLAELERQRAHDA